MSHLNRPVYNFKKLTNIPLKQDIKKNILSRFDKSEIDMSQLILLNSVMKTKDYYNQCVLFCKNGIFDLPDLDDKVLLETDIKYKSISMIAETLKVLRLDLHCDNQYVSKAAVRKKLKPTYINSHNYRYIHLFFTKIVITLRSEKLLLSFSL